ncbi:MAG: DUF2231 domain-containing protein [Candidatus Binataceae bacterium]
MQSLITTLKSFQLHPFVDHFTVAILIIAVIADLCASLFSTRVWIRYMALSLIIVGTGAAWASNVTGGWEADRVWQQVTGPAKDLLERHAKIGDILPWVFLALAIWRIGVEFLSFVRPSRFIYLIIGVLAALAIVYQGRLGAELVYRYGVGTAFMLQAEGTASPIVRATPAGHATPPVTSSSIPTVSVATPTPAGMLHFPTHSEMPAPAVSPSAPIAAAPIHPTASPMSAPSPAPSPMPSARSASPSGSTPVKPPHA